MVPIHFQEQGLPTAYHRYIRTSSALAASKRLSGSTRTEAGAPASLDKQNWNGGEVRAERGSQGLAFEEKLPVLH